MPGTVEDSDSNLVIEDRKERKKERECIDGAKFKASKQRWGE